MKKFLVFSLIVLMCLVFTGGFSAPTSSAQEKTASSDSTKTLVERFLTEGQKERKVRPVAQAVFDAKAVGVPFETRHLFKADTNRAVEDASLREVLNDGVVFRLDDLAVKNILKNDSNFITLQIPGEDGNPVELELVKVNIFDKDFTVQTSAPAAEVTREDLGVHYQGIVKGDPYSVAAVSILKNEIAGFFTDQEKGNYVIGRLGGDNPDNKQIVYRETDLRAKRDRYCAVKDEPQTELPASLLTAPEAPQVTCVRLFLEANYNLFQNKGTVANTASYIAAFFNQSATIYRNDGVSISISDMFVWNSPSPYTSTSSSTTLSQYRATRTSFNGNLAHLLTLTNFGGIAYLNVICNTVSRHGVDGINPTYQNVPTYSWTVDVFTHELGHNLGSSHTHACVWNGNSTAIDGCGPAAGYPTEGGCADPGLPAAGQGTIMSYCHLNTGKNLALGFGDQPRTVIQNRVAAATCLTDCGSIVTAQFSAGAYAASEEASSATVFVARQGIDAGVTVNLATGGGTAIPGQDYTPVNTTVNFAGGETIKAVNIPLINDTVLEPSETINVTLSIAPGGGATIGNPATTVVTIGNTDTLSARTPFDYDGDLKADVSVFRPGNGVWYVQKSSDNSFAINQWGTNGDMTVPADYDGDTKTDLAVFRPSNGTWFWLNSSNGTVGGNQFGIAGDRPVPGDFDGDGKADITIYRASTGTWWTYRSTDSGVIATPFGTAEDKATTGDFDGDGKADLSVFRPSNATWYRSNSSNGAFVVTQFGLSDDKTVPMDYDGDGKTDIAIYRPSNGAWYILNSSNSTVGGLYFGLSEDQPVPGDYDGDGKADPAVFRPSQSAWYMQRSTAGFAAQTFGNAGDAPTPNSFVQ